MKLNKNRKTKNLIISVESRKGGVGKTTAALCMARLLKKERYAVLVLDLDVTGTNAAYIAESPCWENDLYIIKELSKGSSNKQSEQYPMNIIELFDQKFMAGKSIPNFTIQNPSKKTMFINLAKVNVLGSQIYKTDSNKHSQDNKLDGEQEEMCIERPGILFNDLHSFWLLEFVKRIVNNFEKIAIDNRFKKVAIILDNSPGYVGIAPAIHEWLTDRGPDYSKFLTVASLDEQDLAACKGSITALHGLYTGKWETSSQYTKACNEGEGMDISENQKSFFMRLATSGKIGSKKDDPLSFYRIKNPNNSKKDSISNDGEVFCNKPTKYIALIINRVPRYIKTGDLFHILYKVSNQNDNSIRDLFLNKYNNQLHHDRMIYYDEYIENQFLLQSLQRNRGNTEQHSQRLINSLKMAENKLFVGNYKRSDYQNEWFEINHEQYEKLKTQLKRANDVVKKVLLSFENAGLGHLARLIHNEWLPGSIVPGFRSALLKLLSEKEFPYIDMMTNEYDIDSNDLKEFSFIKEFNGHLKSELQMFSTIHLRIKENRMINMFTSILSYLFGLSLTEPFLNSHLINEVDGLFAAVAVIEFKHWVERDIEKSRRFSVQRFLARESDRQINVEKEMKSMKEYQLISRHKMGRGVDSFARFYKACTSAQARLIGLNADNRFLLKLFRVLVESEMDKKTLFPYVKGIAEGVIIKKSISYDEVASRIAKALQSMEYFGEFEEVLKRVLNDWKDENE